MVVTALGIAVSCGDHLLVGCWRLTDGRILKARVDGSAAIWGDDGNFTEGKWESDPFSEAIQRYAITWGHGQTFDTEVSPDGSALRAKRSVSVPGAPPINGERVTEVAIALWCDDWGVMAVNGKVILQAGFQKPEAARMFVKSGDVITIEMTNNGGPMQLGFESFAGKQKFLTAQEFSYTHKPEKDWKTLPRFEFGYRRPLWQVKRGMVIGDVENPTIALRQKEDEKYQKLYFKYVIR